MDDIKKMFRTIVNGQSVLKSELLREIKKLDIKFGSRMDGLETRMSEGFRKVNKRLDRIGKSVAFIEEDAPTNEEFDKLEKRVSKLETSAIKN